MITLSCGDILSDFLDNVKYCSGVQTLARRANFGCLVIITIKSSVSQKTLYKSVLKIQKSLEIKLLESLCLFLTNSCAKLYSEFWTTDLF